MRTPSSPSSQNTVHTVPAPTLVDTFGESIRTLLEPYQAARMPFFGRFAALPREVASNPSLLGQIHLNYQSVMHATRAAVYYLPHLDSPALRKRKLQIFVDDDGLPGGDTHHYQLTKAFVSIGAKCLLDDEEFGEPDELCRHLEAETAHFVCLAPKLYSRSLGAWCAIEVMSVDWMRELAQSISVHFPMFKRQAYFVECFAQEIEERHAAEALDVTQMVLRARPELLRATLRDAKMIAGALEGVWIHLDRIVQKAATELGSGRHVVVATHRMPK